MVWSAFLAQKLCSRFFFAQNPDFFCKLRQSYLP
jgi:hypothetical protein